jgi:hypothetical protein
MEPVFDSYTCPGGGGAAVTFSPNFDKSIVTDTFGLDWATTTRWM